VVAQRAAPTGRPAGSVDGAGTRKLKPRMADASPRPAGHLVPPASRQRAIDASGGTSPDTPSTSTDLAISNSSAAEVDCRRPSEQTALGIRLRGEARCRPIPAAELRRHGEQEGDIRETNFLSSKGT
jgi:hypothetical protein